MFLIRTSLTDLLLGQPLDPRLQSRPIIRDRRLPRPHIRFDPFLRSQVNLEKALQVGQRSDEHLLLLSTHATTSLISRTRADRMRHPTMEQTPGCKNTRLHFSATFARNGSLELTIYGPTFEPTPTSVLLSARSAAKLSRVNMTGSAMKAYTRERRSSFAKATLARAVSGDADGASPVPMRWADISAPKPGVYASSHCWMKKRKSGNGFASLNSNNSRSRLVFNPFSNQ